MENTNKVLTEEEKREARSISPRDKKMGLEFLGLEKRNGNTYKFYKDKDSGEVLYSSSGTEAFEKEMQELEKERKIKKYGRKYA